MARRTILVFILLGTAIFLGASFVSNRASASDPADFSCANVTEIPQIECEALVALYNSTNGPGWINNTGWLDTATPCNWRGVQCADGHVTTLGLTYNQLSGSIPPELGNLTNVEDLVLNSNQLSDSIPPELGNLANLITLELQDNQLNGNVPPELGNLTTLALLFLANNQLSGSIPPELGNLASLYEIDLSFNQLSGSIPPELGSLANLDWLFLRANQLSGSIPPELGNLANLGVLLLNDNQLAGSIPSQLCDLSNIRYLDLGYNALTDGPPCIADKDPDWLNTQTVPPTAVTAAATSNSSAELTWSPILYTGDGGYYEVSYAASPGGPYTVHGVTADKTSAGYLAHSLPPGTAYYFVVRTFTPAHGDQQNALWSVYSQEVAVPLPAIRNIQVANVKDSSFSVSWTTDPPVSGQVRYGADPAHLTLLAEDDRGAGTVDDTHHVTIDGLNPATIYYFDVLAGPAIDDNGGAHHTVTTGAALPVPSVDTVFGQVLTEDGATHATGAIATITVSDADGQGTPGRSALLSTLVTPNDGYWVLNLAEARTPDHAAYFAYSPAGDRVEIQVEGAADCTGDLVTDTADDSPTAVIVLACVQQAAVPLSPGWNLLSLPLEPQHPALAQAVLDAANGQGGSCSEVDRWLNGGWDAHINGLAFNNFPLDLGRGYFMRCSTISQWTLDGFALEAGVPIALQPGWNLVGVPYPQSGYTASSLLGAIAAQGGACSEIDRWHNGGWSAFINGFPFNDFAVAAGKGYFVRCSQASTFTPAAVALQRSETPAAPAPAVPQQAARDPVISQVLVTNRRDTALTISWRTDLPSDGWVAYGPTPDLGQVAYDERGAGTVAALHHVTLAGLAPETTYYFRVHSGDASAGVDDQPIRAATRPFSPPGMPLTAFGQVTSKGAPATGALVSAQLIERDGKSTELLSALVEPSGYWSLSLPLNDCAGVTLVLQAIGADGSVGSLTVPACQAQPAPVLQLHSAAAEPRVDPPAVSQE